MRMTRTVKRTVCAVLLLMAVFSAAGQSVYAAAADWDPFLQENRKTEITESFENPETGYRAVISDDACLMDEAERKSLLKKMEPVTRFGHAAFKSVSHNPSYSTADCAENCYQELFGMDNGLLFLVDMDQRYIYLYSCGGVYQAVTKDYANAITDNVYRYASAEEYYRCAWNVYDQAYKVLDGQKIAIPMKNICNVLLALNLGLFINFFFVKLLTRKNRVAVEDVIRTEQNELYVTGITEKLASTTKHYSPIISISPGGDFGGGSGGGGGGGRSGGGSRGGGGGHRF